MFGHSGPLGCVTELVAPCGFGGPQRLQLKSSKEVQEEWPNNGDMQRHVQCSSPEKIGKPIGEDIGGAWVYVDILERGKLYVCGTEARHQLVPTQATDG